MNARTPRELRRDRDQPLPPPPDEPPRRPHGPPPERTVLSAQDARQGEIILGKYGRWIWIGSFAAIVLFILVITFWS